MSVYQLASGILYAMRRSLKCKYRWSADIAYTVGLIASDGSLSKDGRHIDLTSIDMDQLRNFSLAMGREYRISAKFSGSKTPAYRIQFSDVSYYDFLLSVGLTPAKSMTIASLEIPDQYYPDFLRGLFDGDGSCYAYVDKRWRSSYMYYVTFTSASMDFIRFIQTANSRLAGVGNGAVRKGSRAYIIAYAKKDALKLFNFMYYQSKIICLQRKYNKLASFTVRDQNAII